MRLMGCCLRLKSSRERDGIGTGPIQQFNPSTRSRTGSLRTAFESGAFLRRARHPPRASNFVRDAQAALDSAVHEARVVGAGVLAGEEQSAAQLGLALHAEEADVVAGLLAGVGAQCETVLTPVHEALLAGELRL